MDLKDREKTELRTISAIDIGKQYSCVYTCSKGETRPSKGDLLPANDVPTTGVIAGTYVTSVTDRQERGKPINEILVTAIQPLNYDGGTVYASGTMEVRSSRKHSIDGQYEHLTYLYLSADTVVHTEVDTGNKYVVSSAPEDNTTIPGLIFSTLNYVRFRTIDTITAGQTYEIEGSRKEIDSDPKSGERVFVTTEVVDENIPAKGDAFINRLAATDTGNFARLCTGIQYTTNIIPDRTLVTCSYSAPRQDTAATSEWAAYQTRRRMSKCNGIYRSAMLELHMPNALADSTFTIAAARAGHTYGNLYLNDFQVDNNFIESNARIILNYSTLTADEWMMQNINSALVYRVPAMTSQARLLDLDGKKLFGKSESYPNSHYRITKGENVSFIPKTRIIIRAIVDNDTAANYEPYQGMINHAAMDSIKLPIRHGIYLGARLTPITGAASSLWQLEASFLANTKDWNDQCYLTLWETRKIWVWFDADDETYGKYAGWVEVKLTDNDDGVTAHPGEFYANLLTTHDFSYFGALVS